MDLGAFSVSLTVQDLAASKAFYEKFGFSVVAGGRRSELADHEKRRPHDRLVSRHV